MSGIGEEIRQRVPRLTMSLIMAVIFWIISIFVPPTLSGIDVPGLNMRADFVVWMVTVLITAIFLVRALSDALVLGDVVTDIVIRRLGIKEERPPRRALRDLVYIIVIILAVTALAPLLKNLGGIGDPLSTAATYIALAMIIILIYDIGRILYRIVEEKAETFANKLARAIEQETKNKSE